MSLSKNLGMGPKKQEVSFIMLNINIKFLTLILGSLLALPCFSQLLTQEANTTHLRLNVFTDRNFLDVEKRGERILLRSLNQVVIEQLMDELNMRPPDKAYVSSFRLLQNAEGRVPTIELNLANPRVELFSFYRDRERRHVLDLWLDQAQRNQKPTTVVESTPVVNKDEVARKDSTTQPARPRTMRTAPPAAPAVATPAPAPVSHHRDFRYGASFIWDYAPMAPRPRDPVNLDRKTAEFFYPIRDRNIEESEEEAHLQLSINLYREEKWGLMAKSIQLFEQKYPGSSLSLVNEYLKANALIRENFDRGQSQPVKTAMTAYESLAQKSSDYEMRRGLNKYLITHYYNSGEMLRALQIAQRFYTDSRENFDYEETNYVVEMILSTLANLRRLDEIRQVTKDETIQKIVPAQLILAYEIFSLLSTGDADEVIKLYEEREKGLTRPVLGSILYNVAEAYFRRSNYEKAIGLYDTFVAENSQRTQASNARLRIALAYDLLDRDLDQTLQLYLNAINRSQDHEVSYEARIRYTALRSIRPLSIRDSDRERRIFLERDRRLMGEIRKEIREILWLTRLRTFIVDEKFQEALSYLTAIPMSTLTPAKQRVFEGDGAEIVFGLMKSHFKAGDYARVVQIWELYRDKYVSKVAEDPFVNFIVGKAYLKLGLYQGFDQLYQRFASLEATPQRTFPVWLERPRIGSDKEILGELQVIRNINLKNWDAALSEVGKLEALSPNRHKNFYYRGIIAYNRGQYREAVSQLETFLTRQSGPNPHDPDEVAQMLLGLSDSLYRLEEHDRFRRVATAILSDTRDFGAEHKYLKEVKEKVAYLLIENYAREMTDQAALTLEPMIVRFNQDFPDSTYKGRVQLLLGMAYVRNHKREQGKEVFEQLIQGSETSDVLKELARSELSLLRIKDLSL
jgi:tetratricopeptide (TPR) repeat protein